MFCGYTTLQSLVYNKLFKLVIQKKLFMFLMVLVGSGSVSFEQIQNPDPAIFYTDPDPGK